MGGRNHCGVGRAGYHLGRADLSRDRIGTDGPLAVAHLFVGRPALVIVGAAYTRHRLARAQVLTRRCVEVESFVHLPAFVLTSIIHSAAATAITLSVKPFDDMGSSPT